MSRNARSSNDQRSDVKNPTSKDFAADKANTERQISHQQPPAPPPPPAMSPAEKEE